MKISIKIGQQNIIYDHDTRILTFDDGKSISIEQYIRFNPYIILIINDAMSQEQPPSSE